METRPLGRTDFRVSEIGICLDSRTPDFDRLVERAAERGCSYFHVESALEAPRWRNLASARGQVLAGTGGAPYFTLTRFDPEPRSFLGIALGPGEEPGAFVPNQHACVHLPYNLYDQTVALKSCRELRRRDVGIVATHVLAGGALAGSIGHTPPGARVERLRFLVKPGRTLAQAAVQFVLANESVACALVRVSRMEHLEEILAAPDAPPLTGQELEQIFELYANRFE
jgi:aryl-alcohol dehydrogenase-like predicted oxidoreductase